MIKSEFCRDERMDASNLIALKTEVAGVSTKDQSQMKV